MSEFLPILSSLISVRSGVSLGVSFPLQTPISRLENSGTDARFPYEVRQNVVIGLVLFPLWEQEVPGSNPGAPTD